MRLLALVPAAFIMGACSSTQPPSNSDTDGNVRRLMTQNALSPPYAKSPPPPMRR